MKCHIVIIVSDRAFTIGDGKIEMRELVLMYIYSFTQFHTQVLVYQYFKQSFVGKKETLILCTADKCTTSHIYTYKILFQ